MRATGKISIARMRGGNAKRVEEGMDIRGRERREGRGGEGEERPHASSLFFSSPRWKERSGREVT